MSTRTRSGRIPNASATVLAGDPVGMERQVRQQFDVERATVCCRLRVAGRPGADRPEEGQLGRRQGRRLPAGEVLVERRVGGLDGGASLVRCSSARAPRRPRRSSRRRRRTRARRAAAGTLLRLGPRAAVRSAAPRVHPRGRRPRSSSSGCGTGTTCSSSVRSRSSAQARASSALSPAATTSTPEARGLEATVSGQLQLSAGGSRFALEIHERCRRTTGDPFDHLCERIEVRGPDGPRRR